MNNTFIPKTERVGKLAKLYPQIIKNLESVFDKPTIVYIDFANVRGTSDRLKWNPDPKRMKQLLDSFPNITKVRFYYGTLKGDLQSKILISTAKQQNYDVVTKDVKIKRLSINVTSISMQSHDLIKQFIRKSLLDNFTIQNIEYLNTRLKELNTSGKLYIEDRKCNFDVEIGRHMLADAENDGIENFVLWSGDCDFEDPVKDLLSKGKKVIVFGTRGQISSELGMSGARIFEISNLKNFLCFPKQIDIAL